MPVFKDMIGNAVQLEGVPKRIVSLVPSQTELLFDLGLQEEVIGITKFCIHPEEWFRSKKRIGGTKNLHPDAIRALRPDLVIANKEENVKAQVEALAGEFPVWTSDVNNMEESLHMIREIGSLTGRADKAGAIASEIESRFLSLGTAPRPAPRTAYLIWKDPFMTAGGDTFIHDMLEKAGFENLFKEERRYPQITIEALEAMGCELLLLSSEPYPFKEKHVKELGFFLPRTRILLVDGELFSWYGSRLLHSPSYFEQLRTLSYIR